MKTKINNHTDEEILRWVEWKGIDIQYDLFKEKKFVDDSRFCKTLDSKKKGTNSDAFELFVVTLTLSKSIFTFVSNVHISF